ncbi:MAG: glycosyltransferase family 39 protein [Chloroflexi bacterium]|nr:glycosyltransferase family 39 protein [Chloroflexota bacterium]
MRAWLPAVILLCGLWATRLPALGGLPLHNDEGLHLTRAVEVWNLHPFWVISDGKIINHWPIAALYPQNAPVYAGRLPTLLIAVLGFAAGYALMRARFGAAAAVLGGVLWIASPYLLFFERLALSDAEAGALVVVALWASLRLAQSGARRAALLTGAAFGAAALFKFTALPFALMIALVVLLLAVYPLRRRLELLIITAAAAAACFIVPVAYIVVTGRDFFTIALGWVSSGAGGASIAANIARLVDPLFGFGTVVWAVALLAGLAALVITRPRVGGVLVLAVGLPLISMIVLGREVLPRHFVVALPVMLILAGAGLAALIAQVPSRQWRAVVAVAVLLVLSVAFLRFAAVLYRSPGDAPLPTQIRTQYITEHSGGFGLREAVIGLPNTLDRPDLPIIASMFPDGCRRANFYAEHSLRLTCTDAPGLPQIEAALADHGAVYVLVDTAPHIGADVPQTAPSLAATAVQIGVYPRPGEDAATASVTLWLLTRD